MNDVFLQIYIDKLLMQVTEMTKTLLFKESQIAYLEKLNFELQEQIKQSEVSLQKEVEKVTKIESINKEN